MNNTPLRIVQGKVELSNGSTLLLPEESLQEITVARVGEKGKFFGFGICQQAVVKAYDENNNLSFVKGERFNTAFRVNGSGDYERVCPTFFVKDAKRDEKTKVYTITAYDALDSSVSHVFNELGLVAPYTIKHVVEAISSLLGLSINITDTAFDTEYVNGANFNGDENLREVLNAVAEATQTIYYVDHTDHLIFKRLDKDGQPMLTIPKRDYFELTKALPVTISKIMSVTELGDNVEAGDNTGVVQYVRDNPFWDTRTDLSTLLPAALNRLKGLTVVPYSMKWRGNFLTELGDKIEIETKDGSCIETFILDDSFTYNGGFNQTSDWEYVPDSERVTAANPVTLGEKLNQTFARVDKVNRLITLHASEIEDTKSSVSELQVNTQGINATVNSVEQKVTDLDSELDDISTQTNTRLDTLTSDVALKLDKQGVEITIDQKLETGVDKVVTSSKKYTFDDTGLNVSSPDSEISTRILEDGMRIYKNSREVLIADNKGVKAADLHAVTFLIIGENSRLEDRGNRTACFWIGQAGG
jgi:hypothetical protein